MVVPSKANFNVLLEKMATKAIFWLAIWREDGLVENIEADQSYFLAEVNNITKKNFDKQLATITPCICLGPKYEVQDNEMCSMKLHPNVGFIWEREIISQDYIVVDHEETSSMADSVLRTRASTYKKVIDNLSSECPAYAISPTRWDVDKWTMSKPNFWDKITAYVAENKWNTAKKAEILQKEVDETLVEDTNDDLVDDQMLDYIYDDEPLGFEEDPLGSTTKMRAQDPLEEVNLGDGSVKRPTYVCAEITKEFRDRIVELWKQYKDCFAWDYNEMPGLNREMVELKLPFRPDKKPVKQILTRFAPQILSKIKEEIERFLKS